MSASAVHFTQPLSDQGAVRPDMSSCVNASLPLAKFRHNTCWLLQAH